MKGGTQQLGRRQRPAEVVALGDIAAGELQAHHLLAVSTPSATTSRPRRLARMMVEDTIGLSS
jgi:hypothetical protein